MYIYIYIYICVYIYIYIYIYVYIYISGVTGLDSRSVIPKVLRSGSYRIQKGVIRIWLLYQNAKKFVTPFKMII